MGAAQQQGGVPAAPQTLAQDLGLEQDRKAHVAPAPQVLRVNAVAERLARNHGYTPVGVAIVVDNLEQQVKALSEHIEVMLPLIDESQPGSAFAITGAKYLISRVRRAG